MGCKLSPCGKWTTRRWHQADQPHRRLVTYIAPDRQAVGELNGYLATRFCQTIAPRGPTFLVKPFTNLDSFIL